MNRPDGIPVTVLTGYLGAGKTTRLNRLLASRDPGTLGVVVNDFGAINIDERFVAQRDERTIGLANGCVCCSLADGLGAALDTLYALVPRPERVLVEASGVADPRRMAAYADTWPGYRLHEVIAVVDVTRIEATLGDKYVGETAARQLAGAHRLWLSHLDETPDGLERIIEALRAVAPRAGMMLEWSEGDPTLLFEPVLEHAEIFHEGVHFSAAFRSSRPLPANRVYRWLRDPPSVVTRIKGIVRLDDAPDVERVLQGVPGRWTLEEGGRGGERLSEWVVIWADPEYAERDIRALMLPSGHVEDVPARSESVSGE